MTPLFVSEKVENVFGAANQHGGEDYVTTGAVISVMGQNVAGMMEHVNMDALMDIQERFVIKVISLCTDNNE